MEKVELYVDEQGALYLLPDDGPVGYSGLGIAPLESSRQFAADCELIMRYDELAQAAGILKHPRALLDQMIGDKGMALVAVYEDGRVNLIGAYNDVAAEYIGTDADEWDSIYRALG